MSNNSQFTDGILGIKGAANNTLTSIDNYMEGIKEPVQTTSNIIPDAASDIRDTLESTTFVDNAIDEIQQNLNSLEQSLICPPFYPPPPYPYFILRVHCCVLEGREGERNISGRIMC